MSQRSAPTVTSSVTRTDPPSAAPSSVPVAGAVGCAPPPTGSILAPGSDPGVLPAPVIIADKDNNRLVIVDPQVRTLWEFPRPGDLALGRTFIRPEDVHFTPVANRLSPPSRRTRWSPIIDIATRHIVYRYGSPGTCGLERGATVQPGRRNDLARRPAGGPRHSQLSTSLDPPSASAPLTQLGTTGTCRHQPPTGFGSPTGCSRCATGTTWSPRSTETGSTP
jgi:hypothetical protein